MEEGLRSGLRREHAQTSPARLRRTTCSQLALSCVFNEQRCGNCKICRCNSYGLRQYTLFKERRALTENIRATTARPSKEQTFLEPLTTFAALRLVCSL
ncbi:hypothetical protein NDU88_005178 [Pleurodeles waltl]|uniref:Uncharacterized protein n=1 Tax=Pleurodeles waltl TaxID=8319 RepID=A0AAV7ULC4_PLEWA|nr:hypothetical protein NDU88_005178 [Pleurodeles waltl]